MKIFEKSLPQKARYLLKRDQSNGIRLLFGEITNPAKMSGFPLFIDQ